MGLAKAVKKMRKLESLRVEIAEKNIRAANALSDAANDDNDDNDLPLTTIINALYRHDEGDASKAQGFPSSLKALALVNSHYGWIIVSSTTHGEALKPTKSPQHMQTSREYCSISPEPHHVVLGPVWQRGDDRPFRFL